MGGVSTNSAARVFARACACGVSSSVLLFGTFNVAVLGQSSEGLRVRETKKAQIREGACFFIVSFCHHAFDWHVWIDKKGSCFVCNPQQLR